MRENYLLGGGAIILKNTMKNMENKDLEELVYTAIGEASMCWVGGTGNLEFDSILADKVAKKLCEKLLEWR